MRVFARICFILAASLAVATGLIGLAGCSDDMIASQDDQHTGSVPPAPWESGGPMNMPDPQPGRKY